MRCKFCKKESDEVDLQEGIYESGMIRICRPCAELERVPLIKKPSIEQLDRVDVKYSVRQRMEVLSGMKETTEISKEQVFVQRNLDKLRTPEKKEIHEDVLDNYYWTVNMARRRKKMTAKQLSESVGISQDDIEKIEKGKIPENFYDIFLKLEIYFGIKLLKSHVRRLRFKRTTDEELKILEEVREKLESENFIKKAKRRNFGDDILEDEDELIDDIAGGKADFSKREKYKDVTLSDLMDRKKKTEELEAKRSAKIQTESMLGDEIDLEEV